MNCTVILFLPVAHKRVANSDTPDWYNGCSCANGGQGLTCEEYVSKGWCADGAVVSGQEWALGAQFNYPEQNCVACGKGKAIAITPSKFP